MLAGTVSGQGFQPRSKISNQPNLRLALRATAVFIPGGVIELGDCDTLNRLEASVKFHNYYYAIFGKILI
jgi:hypothetical protein